MFIQNFANIHQRIPALYKQTAPFQQGRKLSKTDELDAEMSLKLRQISAETKTMEMYDISKEDLAYAKMTRHNMLALQELQAACAESLQGLKERYFAYRDEKDKLTALLEGSGDLAEYMGIPTQEEYENNPEYQTTSLGHQNKISYEFYRKSEMAFKEGKALQQIQTRLETVESGLSYYPNVIDSTRNSYTVRANMIKAVLPRDVVLPQVLIDSDKLMQLKSEQGDNEESMLNYLDFLIAHQGEMVQAYSRFDQYAEQWYQSYIGSAQRYAHYA